jgi:8-oxo-dGTP pyrophosphatase MutT (NUDIX family)
VRKVLHDNGYWRYCVDAEALSRRYYAEVPDSVLIIAETSDHLVHLVKQHRAAVGAPTIEFPGGALENRETPQAAALREFAEEMGDFRGSELRALGLLAPSTGMSTERCHVLHLYPTLLTHPTPEDGLEILVVPAADVLPRLLASGVVDAVAVAAWTLRTLR